MSIIVTDLLNLQVFLNLSDAGVAEGRPGDSRDQRNPHVVRAASLQQGLFIPHGLSSCLDHQTPADSPGSLDCRDEQPKNALVWICVYRNIVLMYSKDLYLTRGSTYQNPDHQHHICSCPRLYFSYVIKMTYR